MDAGGWRGGVEMAACSHSKKVNIRVYETLKRSIGLGLSTRGGKQGFTRISCFDVRDSRNIICVLYQGRNHFDALVPGGFRHVDNYYASQSDNITALESFTNHTKMALRMSTQRAACQFTLLQNMGLLKLLNILP